MTSLDTYRFETKPFLHQAQEFLEHGADPIRAILWEQGTGKTKEIIDQAAFLYERGEIDTLIICAPSGVHRNWIEDEIPVHFPKRLRREVKIHTYENGKATTQWHQRACKELQRHKGLSIVAITYQTPMTKHGRTFLWKILRSRVCFYVLDEHTDIKTPKAKTTQRIVASGAYAKYRRIMDGTPITQGPFDVYAPVRFLQPDFWKQHDMDDFGSFKTYFGIYQKGYNKAQDREFETCVGYRRLGELHQLLAPFSSRVLKDDVLDLPPKLFQKLYHEMAPEQARVYKELKENFFTILESGSTVTTELPIVQLLRLQQVVCGYVPVDDDTGQNDPQPVELICDKNPRLDQAKWYCDHMPHKCIIWARFRKDIDLLMDYLGDSAVRYDGKLSERERAESKRAFQTSDTAQFFVANPAAGARGLTLTQAKSVLYYSNSFKYRDRKQSEDRAHRAGQEHPVNYTDLMCKGTVDARILRSLRTKNDVAAKITGDDIKEWI